MNVKKSLKTGNKQIHNKLLELDSSSLSLPVLKQDGEA
jgi:hypothetical protein